MGRRAEALNPARQAVDIRRRLAEVNRTAYLPDLAMPLNNLGNRLAEMWRLEDLSSAQQAANTYGRLAEANTAPYLPALAISLHNLGSALADVGGGRRRWTGLSRAVDIRRRLAKADPTAYLPNLAP